MPDFSLSKQEKKENNLPPEKDKHSKEAQKDEKIISIGQKEKEKDKEEERKYEKTREQPSVVAPPKVLSSEDTDKTAPLKTEKSSIILEIEQILSENLDQLYTSLTPEQKVIFKESGEKASSEIEILLKEFKINVNKVLEIIKEWLLLLIKMVPGVNKIFLIKEAKIKTDKILLLREKELKNKK